MGFVFCSHYQVVYYDEETETDEAAAAAEAGAAGEAGPEAAAAAATNGMPAVIRSAPVADTAADQADGAAPAAADHADSAAPAPAPAPAAGDPAAPAANGMAAGAAAAGAGKPSASDPAEQAGGADHSSSLPADPDGLNLRLAMQLYGLTHHKELFGAEHDAKCVLGWGDERGTVVICFRGTTSLVNITNNLKACADWLGGQGGVCWLFCWHAWL